MILCAIIGAAMVWYGVGELRHEARSRAMLELFEEVDRDLHRRLELRAWNRP